MTYNYIYILQEREFINQNLDIYKIGFSTQEYNKRLLHYSKGSKLIFQIEIDKINLDIYELLNKKHLIKKELGCKYYEGNIHLIIDDIYNFFKTKQPDNEFYKYYNEIDDMINLEINNNQDLQEKINYKNKIKEVYNNYNQLYIYFRNGYYDYISKTFIYKPYEDEYYGFNPICDYDYTPCNNNVTNILQDIIDNLINNNILNTVIVTNNNKFLNKIKKIFSQYFCKSDTMFIESKKIINHIKINTLIEFINKYSRHLHIIYTKNISKIIKYLYNNNYKYIVINNDIDYSFELSF
jgi:hypothetical protein